MMITITKLVTKRLALDPLALADFQAIYAIAREERSIEDFQYVAHSIDDVMTWLMPSYNDPTALTWVIRKQERIIGLFEVCLESQ